MSLTQHRPLTALTLSAGMNTAYTAPSGTAVTINYLSIATNWLSATAGGFSAVVLIGPTANMKTWIPLTGITANSRLVMQGAFPLESAHWGVVISASSASALDVYMGGLRNV